MIPRRITMVGVWQSRPYRGRAGWQLATEKTCAFSSFSLALSHLESSSPAFFTSAGSYGSSLLVSSMSAVRNDSALSTRLTGQLAVSLGTWSGGSTRRWPEAVKTGCGSITEQTVHRGNGALVRVGDVVVEQVLRAHMVHGRAVRTVLSLTALK